MPTTMGLCSRVGVNAVLLLGRRLGRIMGASYGNCWLICHCYSIAGVSDGAESCSAWCVDILG